jgi:hypothetical protein
MIIGLICFIVIILVISVCGFIGYFGNYSKNKNILHEEENLNIEMAIKY